jgi:hypothetical protein
MRLRGVGDSRHKLTAFFREIQNGKYCMRSVVRVDVKAATRMTRAIILLAPHLLALWEKEYGEEDSM